VNGLFDVVGTNVVVTGSTHRIDLMIGVGRKLLREESKRREAEGSHA